MSIDSIQLGRILGPTNPVLIISAQETFLFRSKGFSPFSVLLTLEPSLQLNPPIFTNKLLL